MKLFLIPLVLFTSCLYSQNFLTKGQVYNFEVGDIIQSVYSNQNYSRYTTQEILEKNFSPNLDTIHYKIKESVYVPQYSEDSDPTFHCDTMLFKVSDLNQAVISYTHDQSDSCAYLKDTMITLEWLCNVRMWMLHPVNLYVPGEESPCFETPYFSDCYIEGLGGPYGSVMESDFAYSTSLVYFKKGNLECGIFKSAISELSFNPVIRIFPNPAAEFLYIQTDFPIKSVQITSPDGKISFVQSGDSQGISISELEHGMYFLSVLGINGLRLTQTFIK